MIVYVKGTIAGIGADCAVIENNGIGYRIFMPGSMLDRLTAGDEVKIHTYYHVREDAVQLFGFLEESELALFRMLIGVNGIGPKAALGILSVLSPEELQMAVVTEDIAAICRAPGIGKKTAQKMILELKDHMDLQEMLAMRQPDGEERPDQQPDACPQADDAAAALIALGYSKQEAVRSVRKVANAGTLDTGEILKEALRYLL